MRFDHPFLAVTLGMTVLASSARAQVIPPVPEKTPPSPAYEPPPPPPEPPQPVEQPKPEPPKPLPSLIKRDAGGHVVALETTKARAALLAFEYTDEEREKVNRALEAYRKEVDKVVQEHPGRVLAMRERVATLDQVSGLTEIMGLSETYKGLPTPDLLKTAQTTGAISAVQRRRVDNVIKEYEDAVKQDLVAQYDSEQDVYKLIDITGRQAFLERTLDMRTSLDRQVRDLAPRLGDLLASIEMSAEKRKEAENILKTRMAPEAIAWKVFDEVLDDAQRSALLKSAAPADTESAPG